MSSVRDPENMKYTDIYRARQSEARQRGSKTPLLDTSRSSGIILSALRGKKSMIDRYTDKVLHPASIVAAVAVVAAGSASIASALAGESETNPNTYNSGAKQVLSVGTIACSGEQRHTVKADETAYDYALANINGAAVVSFADIEPHMNVERQSAPDTGLVSADVARIDVGDTLIAPTTCMVVGSTPADQR